MASARKVLLKTVLMLFILMPSFAFASNSIMNVRHWAAPDHTRIVFDTSEESQYTIEKKEDGIVIDFTDASLAPSVPLEIKLKKPDPCKVNLTVLPDNRIRVEIAYPANVTTNIFKLKKVQDKPDRLVIDLELPEIKKKAMQEREQIKVLGKDKVIVIDPGHGGEDPGAVGKSGTMEKDVVLSIGKYLRDILNKKKGYRAFMTRDEDYYVSFKKRTTIAREYGADLFISIHADAATSRLAKGSSVYCLSVRGASSEAAKILAKSENLADLIGGSPNGESADEADPIVLNMFQTNTINVSKIFGFNLLKNLNDIGHVKYNTVQEAPFRVLKLPDIPSLLVETAYISNLKEEKLLRSRKYQKTLAETISRSIIEFLSKMPSTTHPVQVVKEVKPDDSPAAVSEKQEMPEKVAADKRIYVVKEKDSLAKIALEHNTSIETLLRLNHIGLDDALFVGQKLQLAEAQARPEAKPESAKPAAKTAEAPAKTSSAAISRYTVQKGDSIEVIARRHGLTIGELLKLNDMKYNDVLFVGRKLKMRASETIQESKPDTKPESAKTAAKASPETPKKNVVDVYRVKSGDSIEKIARRHDMTIKALLELNDMKYKDVLIIGRKLKVAASEDEPAQEPVEVKTAAKAPEEPVKNVDVSIYKVKNGDSIEKIARRHDMTIKALLELNDMKYEDVLITGRKLKVATSQDEPAQEPVESKSKGKAVKSSSEDNTALTYKVKEGDSLDKIASRHNTTVGALLKLNEIKRKDFISVGRIIKVREADAEGGEGQKASKAKSDTRQTSRDKKKAFVTYQVKRGDTIEVIAKRHKISPEDLLSFNNMTRSDRLIADKKLKIPQ